MGGCGSANKLKEEVPDGAKKTEEGTGTTASSIDGDGEQVDVEINDDMQVAAVTKKTPAEKVDAHGLLTKMDPSPDQLDFFDSWFDHIVRKASMDCVPRVTFYTDGSYFEYDIRGPIGELPALCHEFMESIEMPTDTFDTMQETLKDTKCEIISLWCVLKNIKGDDICRKTGLPGIDLGFTLHYNVPWTLCDMLVPHVDDLELVRKYCNEENVVPTGYAQSLLPQDAEYRLIFKLEKEADEGVESMKTLLKMLLFFKALGFTKPEDLVVEALTTSQASEYEVTACLGEKGLKRLYGTMEDPVCVAHFDLAKELKDFTCAERYTQFAKQTFKSEIKALLYIGDSAGYACAVSYEHEGDVE